ncbi:uracil-DNA glycosylase [Calderihabitans maritimus]|uniref:Type-4 uracil-DNA glycosylase n=1 Tax=Calderihabitans maritimus TaxID=1246530 RepID=A0A1Z5HWK0_9FIRM|nr:uracil-DNA glycosylase [Calderihabitans maritimus]GAW93906.1 uracil-DNA glycosylase, family 4 [Calderihabitans maritimus]
MKGGTVTDLQYKIEKVSSLAELEALCIQCQACPLAENRKQVVFGEGNPAARVIFVGEAPGAREDETGRPFVGAAGQVLNYLLEEAGIDRSQVYITSVNKCRPPRNRLPRQGEAAACYPYLKKQLELIKPQIIVCLGALATRWLIDRKAKISEVRGSWFYKNGQAFLPTFHPAAVLRDRRKAKLVVQDFQEVVRRWKS